MSPVYRLSWRLFRFILRLMFRWDVVGAENLPFGGPVILCANHRSNWDPSLVGASIHRPVHFMAKEELFRIPLLSAWMRAVGVFPVKRGTADLGSFRRALALLQAGQVVGMFPEGTRSRTGQVQEAHAGVAVLAVSSGAPVVPVAITASPRPFGRVQVRIGRPLDLSHYKGKGRPGGAEMSALANEVIMGRIRQMLEEARAECM